MNISEISFCRISGGRLDAFQLGRMENIFDKYTLGAPVVAFRVTLASHIALLDMTSAHMGIVHVNGLLDSFLIATDNLCRGVLLDVLEIYELRIGKATGELSFWIATLFFCFRVMYGWLFVSTLVWTWRRIRAGKLLRDFPQQINAQNMSDWMQRISNHPARLGPVLHNELVFNFLAEEYICGKFEVVQATSEQFSKLHVVDEVRALFVHPDSGECLFSALVESE
jgi:hypothetical protein